MLETCCRRQWGAHRQRPCFEATGDSDQARSQPGAFWWSGAGSGGKFTDGRRVLGGPSSTWRSLAGDVTRRDPGRAWARGRCIADQVGGRQPLVKTGCGWRRASSLHQIPRVTTANLTTSASPPLHRSGCRRARHRHQLHDTQTLTLCIYPKACAGASSVSGVIW